MMCMWTETFHVSVIAPNDIMVYGILFGGMHPIFISMIFMWTGTFHVPVIAPNAITVYGILFGGMHP